MLNTARVVLDLDVRHRVRPAFVADQQAVTLGIVAAVFGLWVHRNQSAIGILRLARRDTLGHDAGLGVFAKVDHFGARVGLLHVIGNCDRVEFSLAVVTAQNARWVFPRHGRAGFHLSPHHLGAITATIGAFGHEIIDAAYPVFITGVPVLDG